MGRAYHLLGESYWVEGIFNNLSIEEKKSLLQQGIGYFEVAEEVFREGKDWRNLVENHLNMGFVRVHLGEEIELAEVYSNAAIGLVKEKFPLNDSLQHITFSQAYGTLMKIYRRFIGDFDKALNYANLSLEHRFQLPNKLPQDKLWLAGKYLKKGLNTFNKRGREQAFLYLKKAEDLIMDIPPNKIGVEIYHSMGFLYVNNSEYYSHYHTDFDKAITYHQKAREVVEAKDFIHKNEQEKYKVEIYCWLSMIYLFKEDIDSADYWMAKVHHILKKNSEEEKRNEILLSTYFRRAVYQKNHNQLEEALITMKPCMEYISTLKNFRVNESISDWYNLMGEIYAQQEDYINALTFFQQSFAILSNKKVENNLYTNPKIEEVVLKLGFIQTLHYKAKTLCNYYYTDKKVQKRLEAAFETYQTAIEAIEIVRREYLAEDKKKILGENTFNLFEEAIAVSLQLYKLTKDDYYQEQAFIFSEKSKVNLLIETIDEKRTKSVYLPDSLLEKEKQQKVDLAFYQQLLYEEKRKEQQDELKMKLWEEKVFQLKQSQELFHETLSQKYPHYFELKYTSKTIRVEDIRRMLSTNQIFIEFFWGEKDLYVFMISADNENFSNIQTYRIENTKELKKEILTLIEYHQNPNCVFDKYVRSSNTMYQKIFKNIVCQLDGNIENLIIVTDGMLSYLPFEALITELPTNKAQPDYSIHNLAYLLEDFQISYTYSASLSLQHENIFDPLKKRMQEEKTLLAYAPSFYGEYDGLLVRSCADTLAELQCAKAEVQNLQNKWKGEALVGEQATKQHFLEQAVESDILHLATHACMDDKNPNFNRIYFANEEYMTSLELYSLQLKSQMTVLSACNTGNGKLLKGEGIMSLARSFMAAGCSSLVITLWGVNDCTTMDLMTHFYEHLYDGQRKDEALRNAKLSYLQNPETTRLESHPFYWAAFVQLGDSRAMFEKKNGFQSLGFCWMYGVGLTLFVLLFGFWKRKNV